MDGLRGVPDFTERIPLDAALVALSGHARAAMDYDLEERRRTATRDGGSAVAGFVAVLAFHVAPLALYYGVMFALALLYPGRHGRAHAATPPPAHDEEILEGALLRQGGGGEYDPRRQVHRQVPIRAEERAHTETGLNTHAHPNPHEPTDAGPRRDPNALITQRDILGTGNQDLAEQLTRMAQSENANNVNAPPGPGSPDGSVNGTEADPNRAGTGAGAKIRSFLQRNLHLLATAPSSAHRTFTLRITIASDGNSVVHGEIVQGSGDDTVDSDLSLQLGQLAENHSAIPELTDEEKTAIASHSFRVRYTPD